MHTTGVNLINSLYIKIALRCIALPIDPLSTVVGNVLPDIMVTGPFPTNSKQWAANKKTSQEEQGWITIAKRSETTCLWSNDKKKTRWKRDIDYIYY